MLSFPVRYPLQSELPSDEPQRAFERQMTEFVDAFLGSLLPLRKKCRRDGVNAYCDHYHHRSDDLDCHAKIAVDFPRRDVNSS